jgi:hypothetical protein
MANELFGRDRPAPQAQVRNITDPSRNGILVESGVSLALVAICSPIARHEVDAGLRNR